MASVLVCPECGHRNPHGTTFCEQCGNFLDWSGVQEEEDDTQTGAAPQPSPPPAPEPLAEAVTEPLVPAPEPVPATEPLPTEDITPSRVEPPRREAPPAEPPRPEEPVARGWRTVLPGDAPAPARPAAATPAQIVRKPEEARERHVVTAPRPERTTPLAPGEIACPVCGTGNTPQRRFCRRCGTSLATGGRPVSTAHPSQLPSEAQLRAAQRRYRRSLVLQHRVGRLIAAGLGATIALYALAALVNLGGLGDWTRGRLNQFLPGTPVGGLVATAVPGDEVPDFGAANVVDPIAANSAWATNWNGPANPQPDVAGGCVLPENQATGSLVLELPPGTHVGRVAIGAGLPADDPERLSQWRPTAVHLRFSDGSCSALRLADTAAMQDVHLDVRQAAWMQVIVVAAAQPQAGDSPLVAIHTVEVFSPQFR